MGPFLQAGGVWVIKQDNGFSVTVNIIQDQDRLSAAATSERGVHSTYATGFVSGPNFELTITWEGGTVGKYTGKLEHGWYTPPPLGYLKGMTVDMTHPGNETTWVSEGHVFEIS